VSALVTPYDLSMTQPKQIKAWVDDSWRDIGIPKNDKGQPRWKLVHETLQTLQATRVQLLDESGGVLKAMGDAPEPGPAPAPAAAGSMDLDTFASRMAEAQRVALSAHVEAMRPAWEAVTKSQNLVAEMAKQMNGMLSAAADTAKAQQELVGKLAELLQDVTDDAVAGRLEAAEQAVENATAEKADNQDRMAGLIEKAMEFVGPAVAERLAPH
jgi:hypothetical protein